MPNERMDQILDSLDQARQRATYGAVAAMVGSSPRTLMAGRDRDRRHSWVVSRKSGQPTGYEPDQLHPELMRSERVIETREELERWLAARTGCGALHVVLAEETPGDASGVGRYGGNTLASSGRQSPAGMKAAQ